MHLQQVETVPSKATDSSPERHLRLRLVKPFGLQGRGESGIVLHLGNLQALAWHSLFCVAVSQTYSYSTVGSMLGRPRGIPLQRLSAHLLRAMPSWGLGSLSLAVQKVILPERILTIVRNLF